MPATLYAVHCSTLLLQSISTKSYCYYCYHFYYYYYYYSLAM